MRQLNKYAQIRKQIKTKKINSNNKRNIKTISKTGERIQTI